MEIQPLPLRDLQRNVNILTLLSEDEANYLGRKAKTGYLDDKRSRQEWEKQITQAEKLALQVAEHKAFPWQGASNVKFPLLTIATLQFAARAYATLVRTPDIVKVRTVGKDESGAKRDRAERVARHMSWQILEQDEDWEEQMDRLLMTVPILGCAFKKTWHDEAAAHNRSICVHPRDLVLNYFTKSLKDCERKTHRIWLRNNVVRERMLLGLYVNTELGAAHWDDEEYMAAEGNREKMVPPEKADTRPRLILEQHCWYDLDGDGYAEPYVLTVDFTSGKALRLVNRFRSVTTTQDLQMRQLQSQLLEGQLTPSEVDDIQRQLLALDESNQNDPEVVRITPVEYFTKYSFIPAPDGSFYDLGFGALIGPINESVNSIINQLIDSGSLQNQNSGFIGRGARITGGRLRFGWGEWKRVDVAGSTLRDSLVPLPVQPPSPVLFSLLGLLVDFGQRIASVSETMQGENPGQNTPAYNMQAMMQQGLTVFSSIFKRLYRSLRDEFRQMYRLNSIYLKADQYYRVLDGEDQRIYAQDYRTDPYDITPVADPNNAIPEEQMRQAMLLAQRADMFPGYDRLEVERRMLEAMQVADIQSVLPVQIDAQNGRATPQIQPPMPPEMQMNMLEEQRRAMEAKDRRQLGEREAAAKEAVAAADVELKKAQTVKAYAEAGGIEVDGIVKQMDSATKRLDSIIKGVQANETNRESGGGMDRPSGNGRAGQAA